DQVPVPLRAVPPLAVGATGLAQLNLLPRNDFFVSYYGWTAAQILPGAAVALIAVVLLLGAGLALRADHRGGWALLVLLTPIGLLSLHPLAGVVDGLLHGAPQPAWSAYATTALAVVLVGPAVLPLALALRRRTVRPPAAHTCPTCGSPR
ncbi:hypothetical protein ACFQZ8_29300, partial [Micromonospora azadirachtae]